MPFCNRYLFCYCVIGSYDHCMPGETRIARKVVKDYFTGNQILYLLFLGDLVLVKQTDCSHIQL